jgi:hemolysin III
VDLEPAQAARRPRKAATLGEEIANSITHGAGLLLGIAALVLVVVFAALRGTAIHVVSGAIYGSTLILLYAASTFYHAFPPGRTKRVFGVLDHSAIFLLIAGTYTPFTLVTLGGAWGWSIFGVIWGLAVAGVVLEAVSLGRARKLQVVLYLAMGWMCVVAGRPLLDGLEAGGLMLLLAGGLCYTLGVVFYAWRRLPFHHAVWHVFVLGGSVCHFFAVLLYVIPHSP